MIEKEEKALAGEDPDKSASKDSDEDPVAIIKGLKTEVEQLQKKLNDVEKEHTKAVHSVRRYSPTICLTASLIGRTSQLNKDIVDLEQLVEAKIYREVRQNACLRQPVLSAIFLL